MQRFTSKQKAAKSFFVKCSVHINTCQLVQFPILTKKQLLKIYRSKSSHTICSSCCEDIIMLNSLGKTFKNLSDAAQQRCPASKLEGYVWFAPALWLKYTALQIFKSSALEFPQTCLPQRSTRWPGKGWNRLIVTHQGTSESTAISEYAQ